MDKTKASVEEKSVIAKMCTSDDLGAEKKCSLESDYSCWNRRVARAETLILGGVAGLFEENWVVFLKE